MRSRPKFAVAMWKKVWRRQPVTEARVAAWVLLVACFRYLGTQQFMEDAMLAGAKESLSAGLTEESLEAVVGGLEHSIREALKFRTSVSAWLDSGDGRRRYFRRAAERVPVVAPRCRPVDHLLIEPWKSSIWVCK
eukprot:g9702.t1